MWGYNGPPLEISKKIIRKFYELYLEILTSESHSIAKHCLNTIDLLLGIPRTEILLL